MTIAPPRGRQYSRQAISRVAPLPKYVPPHPSPAFAGLQERSARGCGEEGRHAPSFSQGPHTPLPLKSPSVSAVPSSQPSMNPASTGNPTSLPSESPSEFDQCTVVSAVREFQFVNEPIKSAFRAIQVYQLRRLLNPPAAALQ